MLRVEQPGGITEFHYEDRGVITVRPSTFEELCEAIPNYDPDCPDP